ncbi:MAG: squalene/phytoene synthase family protein, partial [Spirochaetaceae bacterium]
MTDAIHYETFKSGSKTYFNSSVFFPRDVREDVFVLYGFVRVADNYVDQVPQDAEGFYEFRRAYEKAL